MDYQFSSFTPIFLGPRMNLHDCHSFGLLSKKWSAISERCIVPEFCFKSYKVLNSRLFPDFPDREKGFSTFLTFSRFLNTVGTLLNSRGRVRAPLATKANIVFTFGVLYWSLSSRTEEGNCKQLGSYCPANIDLERPE